jgi:hypothetical protein
MGRAGTAAALAETKAPVARPVALVKLAFDSGEVRVWSGGGDLSFAAEVYSGVGELGRISLIEEGVEQRAFTVTLTLSGIPPATVALALAEDVQGRACKVWAGFLDSAYALVADPVPAFEGRMDTMDVALGATGEVTVTAVSRLAAWGQARLRLYTDAGQVQRFPGDRGFEFVNATVQKEIVWGGAVAGGQGGGTVAAGQGGSGAAGNRGGTGEGGGTPGRPGGGN